MKQITLFNCVIQFVSKLVIHKKNLQLVTSFAPSLDDCLFNRHLTGAELTEIRDFIVSHQCSQSLQR